MHSLRFPKILSIATLVDHRNNIRMFKRVQSKLDRFFL
jgi:hypothetical protein